MEKSPRLNGTTQFLTVAYDGACSPNVSFSDGVNFLGRLALQGGKNLLISRVSMLLKSRASPDMPLSACVTRRDL